jgi:hypothetical protein
MNYLKNIKASLCLLAALSAPQLSAFTIYAKVPLIKDTMFVGHEEISRQSILMMNYLVKEQEMEVGPDILHLMTDLKKLKGGKEAKRTQNPLVLGNRAADDPDQEEWPIDIRRVVGLASKDEVKSTMKDGGFRALHFTRNEYEGVYNPEVARKDRVVTTAGKTTDKDLYYDSAQEACMAGRDYITIYSQKGMEYIQESNNQPTKEGKDAKYYQGLFTFGVATHVIQDSFSPSHTYRSSELNESYEIVDVCSYDQKISHVPKVAIAIFKGVYLDKWGQANRKNKSSEEDFQIFSEKPNKACVHGKFDHRDFIWLRLKKQREKLLAQPSSWKTWESEILEKLAIEDKSGEIKSRLKYCQDKNKFSNDFTVFYCMKLEARLARTATLKYYMILLDHINEAKKSGKDLASEEMQAILKINLSRYLYKGSMPIKTFGINNISKDGIMNCESLGTSHSQIIVPKPIHVIYPASTGSRIPRRGKVYPGDEGYEEAFRLREEQRVKELKSRSRLF